MELWAGELGAAVGKSVVGTEISLERSTEESGGLALTVGQLALARMGFVHPVLGFVLGPSLFMAWIDTQQVCLPNLQLTQTQQGFAAGGLKARSYPERQQIITRV